MFGVDDAAAGAIIGAAGTVIGAGTSAVAQSSLNKKTREFNREEAEKQRLWSEKMYNEQNAWNYEMWMKQNEYNTPEAQVQRMRDAGLNPLYYGLDGSSASGVSAAQPLGYERAEAGNQVNPMAAFQDVAMKSAQIKAMELENALKQKDLEWYDREHGQEFDFKSASIDEIRERIDKIKNDIANGEMDILLKQKGLDKVDAEIATEWARYASIGLDNELKEQINPLIVRAQELENAYAQTRNQYQREQILAQLAETRAHTAALYAQAALAGAQKEGVDIDNKVKAADAKFANANAQNRANLLKWTADEQGFNTSILRNTWKSKVSVEKYYSEHYEEAFRNYWSQSGRDFGIAKQFGSAIGNASMLGLMLAL